MKKILSLLIAGLLLVSLVACGDSEADKEKNDVVVEKEYVEDEKQTGKFEYEDFDGKLILTGYDPYNDIDLVDLVLPTEAKDGRLISGIADEMFKGCSVIKSVTIPSTYETIGECAFANCEALTSVKFEIEYDQEDTTRIVSCVESIGDGAFMNCVSLQKIELPAVITEVTKNMFSQCKALKSIDLSNVTTINGGAFTACSSLQTIKLSDKLEYADNLAFYGCTSLKYTVEDGLCYLGNTANKNLLLVHSDSLGITSATVNSKTKVIADHAFLDCESLSSIKLSDSVKVINGTSFEDCSDEIYTVYENGNYLGTEENPYMVLINMVMPNVEDFTIHKDTKIITNTALAKAERLGDIDFDGTVAEWKAIIKADEWTHDLILNVFCDGSTKPITEPAEEVED